MISKMNVFDFGNKLLELGDLDPVYTALWGAQLGEDELRRWLVAYWCFYHCGTASWIVDQGPSEFWPSMMRVAVNEGPRRYPRGTERRHFRGELAKKSVTELRKEWDTPTRIFEWVTAGKSDGPIPLESIMRRVQMFNGFGPWISFKVADMLERLDLCPIRFDASTVFLFKSPQEGAEEMCRQLRYQGDRDVNEWAVDTLLGGLRKGITGQERLHLAPPRFERGLNVQEAETVLCKWKSYLGGHYPPGKDCREIWEGLLSWSRCPTSQRLLRSMREAGIAPVPRGSAGGGDG